MSEVRICDVDPQGEDALYLLNEATVDARALYPELFVGTAGVARNEPLPDRGVYVVAYIGDQALGCGALRPLSEGIAELRRMYVHRDHRRSGLGGQILKHLLGAAERLGYSQVVLETGYKQHAAMRLYERHGFRRVEPFGEYVNDPTSVCYAPAVAGA